MPSRDVLPALPGGTHFKSAAAVDEAGRLVLPAELAAGWGMAPGDRVREAVQDGD